VAETETLVFSIMSFKCITRDAPSVLQQKGIDKCVSCRDRDDFVMFWKTGKNRAELCVSNRDNKELYAHTERVMNANNIANADITLCAKMNEYPGHYSSLGFQSTYSGTTTKAL